MSLNNIPLSIYIHLPWCIKKCPYCDFNSHPAFNNFDEQAYLKSLLDDLIKESSALAHRQIISVFFGGGTPSLFSGEAIHKIIQTIRAHFNLKDNAEITLEANPGTVEQDRFSAYHTAGVNRLSLGIQSFDPEKLLLLGRIHDGLEARQAIATAKKAGLHNINLDIMYALPQQTLEQACLDLSQAFEHQPTHLSWYHLTLEPNTYFYRHPPVLPEEEIVWQIQDTGASRIEQAGFKQYEISAFCQPGYECLHNLNYWQFGDYLGVGAGAHSKITNLSDLQVTRYSKIKHPKLYMASTDYLQEKHPLGPEDLKFEFMLNALRLQNDIDLALFQERTGLELIDIETKLQQAELKGFLRFENNHVKLSPLGRRYVNDVISIFLPESV